MKKGIDGSGSYEDFNIGTGAGAGAAEKFYSEPEPEPEPEYFHGAGAGAGADQKCHGSASLLRTNVVGRFDRKASSILFKKDIYIYW